MAKIEIDEATQKDLKECFDYIDGSRGDSDTYDHSRYVEAHILSVVKCLLGCKFILPKLRKDDREE